MKLILTIIPLFFVSLQAIGKPVFNINECNKISMIAKRNLNGYYTFLDQATNLILEKNYKKSEDYSKLYITEKSQLVEWATIYNAFCK